MSQFWRKNGSPGPIGNAKGALIRCTTCACEGTCYNSLIDAIIERQKAANETPWTTPITKTLAECKTEVNRWSDQYLSGLWTGGASGPSWLSNTYANSATDFCELYTLVKAMVTTGSAIVANVDVSGLSARDSYTSASSLADAVSNLADPMSVYTAGGAYAWGWSRKMSAALLTSPTRYRATAACGSNTATIAETMTAAVNKDLRYYCQSIKPNTSGTDVFSKQGHTIIPDENQWGVVATASLGAATTYTPANPLGYDVTTPTPPDAPAAATNPTSWTGFETVFLAALIDWDFYHQ